MPLETGDASYVQHSGESRHSENLLREVYQQGDMRSYSPAQIQAIHSVTSDFGLPGLHLFDSDGLHDGILSGAGRVVGEMASGVVDEAIHNPLGLLRDAAIGAGIAVVATALAPIGLVGAAAVGVAALGVDIAMGGNPIEQVGDLFEGVGDFMHDAGVVANPDWHSNAEVLDAHEGVHEAGEFTAELAAGAAGAGIGSLAAPLVRTGAIAAYDAAAPAVSGAARVAMESVQPAVSTVGRVATNAGNVAMEHIAPVLERVGPTVANISSGAMERLNPMMSSASRLFSRAGAGEAMAAERTFVDDAATQAWPGAQSARLVGEDLLDRSVIEAARVGESDGFTYALRRFTEEAEIRNYVRAALVRYPGQAQIMAEEVAHVGAGGANMPGTAGIWMDEIVRHWPMPTA